jgi:hypothetical protein
MSVEITAHTASSIGFTSSLRVLFRSIVTRFKVQRVADDMRGMTDRYLLDVGLDRPLISDAWERAMVKNRLLESGWRYSQRV